MDLRGSALLGENDLLFSGDDLAQVIGFEIRVASALRLRLETIEHAFELCVSHAHHDLRKQRREPAVSVERKAKVTCLLGEALNRLFV